MQAVTDLWRILPIFWTINFLLRVNLKLIVTKFEQQCYSESVYVIIIPGIGTAILAVNVDR